MSTTYAGNPANYPTSITIPSDGDGPGIKAADVNAGFEGLADRTANITDRTALVEATIAALDKRMLAGTALSFRSAVTMLANTSRIRFAGLTWLGGGSTLGFGTMIRTKNIRSWPGSNEIVSLVNSFDGAFDVDPSGNIVQPGSGATDGAKINEYNGASWTVRTGLFSPSFIAPDVVYDPFHALWCVAGKKNGVAALGVYTSPNRTAWTSRTAPTVTNDGFTGPYCRLATDGAGTIVMEAFKTTQPAGDTADTVSFSRSTDGGVSWSAADGHNITWGATGGGGLPCPVWDGSKWVAVTYNLTSKETYVYNSADGAAFTQVAHLTTCAIQNIVALGALVAGFAKDKNADFGRVVISLDSGVTWQYTDECVPGLTNTLAGIAAAGSRLLLVDAAGGNIYVGAGTGTGVEAVT